MSVRHCAVTTAPYSCCPNCYAGQSHKDNVRSSADGKRLKQKKSNSLAQLHLPALGLFWASFFVRIQLTSLFLISPGLWVGEAEFQLDNFRTVLKKSLYMCLASSLVVRIFFKTLHAQYASSQKCCDLEPSVCFPKCCKLIVDRSSKYFFQQNILLVHAATIKVSGVVSHAGIKCFYHFHIWIN